MSEKKPRARIVIEIGDKNANGKLDVSTQVDVNGVPFVGSFSSPTITVDVPSAAQALSMLGPDAKRLGEMIDAGTVGLT